MKRKPIPERFWKNVKRGATDECWPWVGSKDTKGYGHITIKGRLRIATRVAYFIDTGEWPSKHVLHRCDNPACVNPSHLFLGTHSDNMKDMAAKGRVPRGENHQYAKLTESSVVEMRKRASNGGSRASIASSFNLSLNHCGKVLRRLLWKHIP